MFMQHVPVMQHAPGGMPDIRSPSSFFFLKHLVSPHFVLSKYINSIRLNHTAANNAKSNSVAFCTA